MIKKPRYNNHILALVDDDTRGTIEEIADREHSSMAAAIRDLLNEALNARGLMA
jgi:hypothetical protein